MNIEPVYAPTIVAVLDGNQADITYACVIDVMSHQITLPDNLPGGTMVYADGVHIYTAPVSLAEKASHAGKRAMPQPTPLAIGIRAGILMMQESAEGARDDD